jgi:hypothetical protein
MSQQDVELILREWERWNAGELEIDAEIVHNKDCFVYGRHRTSSWMEWERSTIVPRTWQVVGKQLGSRQSEASQATSTEVALDVVADLAQRRPRRELAPESE